jgi:hypothetical protein
MPVPPEVVYIWTVYLRYLVLTRVLSDFGSGREVFYGTLSIPLPIRGSTLTIPALTNSVSGWRPILRPEIEDVLL